MEGFWKVEFAGVQGFGAGVLTLIAGQIFGGDTSMLYRGTYAQQGNSFTAQLHVSRHTQVPGMQSVMGANEFELNLNGMQQGNSVTVSGSIPGTQLRLNATLTKLGDLPPRA